MQQIYFLQQNTHGLKQKIYAKQEKVYTTAVWDGWDI